MSLGRTSRRKSQKVTCIGAGSTVLRGATVAATTVKFLTPLALVVGAAAIPCVAQAQTPVGKLSITRQVLVTKGTVAQSAQYVPAKQNQAVFDGQGIRTLKRALAEVTFSDTSVLRINERTDLVLQNSATLRNVQLRAGVVWIRVARGTNTQIETPSATAVARGTTFVVAVGSDGASQLTVLDGRVDMVQGAQAVSVGAGETISVAAPANNGAATLPSAPSALSPSDLPEELGGSAVGWWQTIGQESGLLITAGSPVQGFDLRSSPLTEVLQQAAQNERGITTGNYNRYVARQPYYLNDPFQRDRLIAIARQSLVTAIQNSGLSLSAYQQANGNLPVASLGVNAADLAFLQSINISTVGQAIDGTKRNSGTLNVIVDTRSAYRPGNINSLPNYDFRLLDRNDTSLTLLGVGAGLGLLADAAVNKNLTVSTPRGEASAWAFANDPSIVGARGGLTGRVGNTRYRLESNAIRVLSGDNVRTNGKLDSVAVVEHTIGDSVTVFAGRDRFYGGPVFQNQVLSQLIADRYSALGATVRQGDATLKAAYLYDANPDVTGSQKGALASLSYKLGGGLVGINALRVPKLDNGYGLTGSLSYNIVPGQVDFYAELGRGPDKATLQTYGAYFPGLFQKTDVDLFVEYGEHTGLGRAVSLIAAKDVGRNLNVRAYANLEDGTRRTQVGAAAIFRIGSR